MQSVIEKFYNGKINPSEQIFRHDKRYRNHLKKQCESEKSLRSSLSREQQDLFENYQNQKNQTDSYIHRRIFRYGFLLGARLLLEATSQVL